VWGKKRKEGRTPYSLLGTPEMYKKKPYLRETPKKKLKDEEEDNVE